MDDDVQTSVDRWIGEVGEIDSGSISVSDRINRLGKLLDEIETTRFLPGQAELTKLGFVLYLASLSAVTRIHPPTDMEGEEGSYHEITLRAARLYRQIPSPDLAAYGLLAIRAEALAYSKCGLFEKYLDSRLSFDDCRRRADRYLKDHPRRDDVIRQRLLEVIEQVDLAETGTSARVAEERLTQWEDLGYPVARHAALRASSWRRLCDGIRHGQASIAALSRLQKSKRLREGTRTWEQISTFDWQFRPYLMTARCHMNAVPYCWLFADNGGVVKPQFRGTWPDEVKFHRQETEVLFGEMVRAPDLGVKVTEHVLREIAQIRLQFALLFPGRALPADLDEPCLSGDYPDKDALSLFLCRNNNDANIIGSISDKIIIDVINRNADGYRNWWERSCCLARPKSSRRRNCPACVHREIYANEGSTTE